VKALSLPRLADVFEGNELCTELWSYTTKISIVGFARQCAAGTRKGLSYVES